MTTAQLLLAPTKANKKQNHAHPGPGLCCAVRLPEMAVNIDREGFSDIEYQASLPSYARSTASVVSVVRVVRVVRVVASQQGPLSAQFLAMIEHLQLRIACFAAPNLVAHARARTERGGRE